jgi:Mor family transcriptional regulator
MSIQSISARNRQMYIEYQSSGASLELLARRYRLSMRTVEAILRTQAWLAPPD